MSRLVAVTGATGFVGPHLVSALARHGWKVRLLIRRWAPLPSLAGVEAELVFGDLADERALAQLVTGVDAVIHAAALIKARRPADFFTVNRDGTALLSAVAVALAARAFANSHLDASAMQIIIALGREMAKDRIPCDLQGIDGMAALSFRLCGVID